MRGHSNNLEMKYKTTLRTEQSSGVIYILVFCLVRILLAGLRDKGSIQNILIIV